MSLLFTLGIYRVGGLVSLCYLHGSYLQVGDLQYIQACYICQR